MLTAGANELAHLYKSPSLTIMTAGAPLSLDEELCGSWFVSPSDGGVEAGMPVTQEF